MSNRQLPNFSRAEEIFNAITHIVGGGFGVVSLIILIVATALKAHGALAIISVIIYGLSMILLYTMSSIYHFLRASTAKKVFRVLDHCTIYFLIAGTYTPICIIALKDNWLGLVLLLVVWITLIIGVTLNAINMHHHLVKKLSMFLYIVAGWSAITCFIPLVKVLSFNGFLWILSGGITYSIGIIFYLVGDKIKFTHGIWHLFVILGTLIQFVGILFYVVL